MTMRLIDASVARNQITGLSRNVDGHEIHIGFTDKYVIEGMKLFLDLCPTIEAVPRAEFESLEKRLQHLLQSDYIRSFDEVELGTGEYKRDINEAVEPEKPTGVVEISRLKFIIEGAMDIVRTLYGDAANVQCKTLEHVLEMLDNIAKEE